MVKEVLHLLMKQIFTDKKRDDIIQHTAKSHLSASVKRNIQERKSLVSQTCLHEHVILVTHNINAFSLRVVKAFNNTKWYQVLWIWDKGDYWGKQKKKKMYPRLYESSLKRSNNNTIGITINRWDQT